MRTMKKMIALLLALCLLCGLCFTACSPKTDGAGEAGQSGGKTGKAEKALGKLLEAFTEADGAEVLAFLIDESKLPGERSGAMNDLYKEFGEDFVSRSLAAANGESEAVSVESEPAEKPAFESGALLSVILEYTTVTMELDKDGETVTLELEVPDLYRYFTEEGAPENCDTPKALYKEILNILDDEEWDTEEYSFELTLVKTDDGYRLTATPELVDALYGGLLRYYAGFSAAYYRELYEAIAKGGADE